MKNSFGDKACYMKMKNLLHLFLILFFPLQCTFAQSCSDSLATTETKALYKNLYTLIGKNILFGNEPFAPNGAT